MRSRVAVAAVLFRLDQMSWGFGSTAQIAITD
jgi:hypothetical protein